MTREFFGSDAQALLARLGEIAVAAGREILEVYAQGAVDVRRKADSSPVTDADLRADRVIRAALAREFADVFVLSEESLQQPATPPAVFFLVDPLDGTKEFLQRNGEFTVNIALIDGGRAVAGVVHAPVTGELFAGAAGAGAFRRVAGGEPVAIRTRPPAPGAALRVIGSRSHADERLAHWLAQLPPDHRFEPAGSSLKFCRIAEGAADVYPRFGPTCQWDTAAGQAVLEAAGGAVLQASGEDLAYGFDRPHVNPSFIALADRALRVPTIA